MALRPRSRPSARRAHDREHGHLANASNSLCLRSMDTWLQPQAPAGWIKRACCGNRVVGFIITSKPACLTWPAVVVPATVCRLGRLEGEIFDRAAADAVNRYIVGDTPRVAAQSAAFHTSSSLRSKFHSLRPETTFLKPAGAASWYVVTRSCRAARSSAVGASTTASFPNSAI